VEDEEHFCVGCPGLRGPLLKLMEQAHSGFELLQDKEKFIRIMLHANADDSDSRTELHELITIVVSILLLVS